MILDIMDVDRFVKINNLPKIASSLYFAESGVPDDEGLFSYRIFGNIGSKDRKMRMAYIELDGKYLHPQIYKILSRVDEKMPQLISGTKFFRYDEKIKYFVPADEDEENPNIGTGLEFLYLYWDKLSFKHSASISRENRLDLLDLLKKDECFIDKQVIMPAFYRDATVSGSQRIPEVNGLYKKIFNGVSILTTLGKSSFTYNLSRSKIQTAINEVFELMTNFMRLKTGFLHASLMSKSVDYGVRSIITAPTFNTNTWQEMPADYEHCAVPLSQCISEFTIAIYSWIIDWVDSIVQGKTNMYIFDAKENKVVLKDLSPDWKQDFSSDKLIKKIYLFVMSPESRFYPVTIKFDNGEYKPFAFIDGNRDLLLQSGEYNTDALKNIRYYTWTDVFFLAANECVSEKAMNTTRYPVTDHHSQYFSKIRVRSTIKVMKMLIGNTMYDNYPVIDLSVPPNKVESLFVDSLEIFPPYLKGLGGDFDGDMTSSRGLYSYESNKWTNDYILSVTNAIGINGQSIRTSGDVGFHALYNLLRNPDERVS